MAQDHVHHWKLIAYLDAPGVAAVRLGRRYIGIELSERYNKMAQRRLEKVTAPMALAEVWR